MFTILHLSDLHRSSAEPFSNDEILSSLRADMDRYPSEHPSIAKPDAIIISGDLVAGLLLGAPTYPAGLVQQYEVACDLLIRLADTFLGGNRSNLLMIPGNHDVDFNRSRAAMSEVQLRGPEIKGALFDSGCDNPYRWCWTEANVYRITDETAYADRFKYYCDTFNRFYEGVRLAYPVDPNKFSNLFELDEGRIVVAAFNSCHGNDCFSYVGEISTPEIAKCHLAIAESGKRYRLKLAVWHHDVAGPPRRSDYMDSDIVKLMIDKGFRLGLHGHLHKARATVDWVHTARRTEMVVVGAGSLCAEASDTPRGVSREYNVIEIGPCYAKARVHVREAKVSDIFSAGRFIDLSGKSFEDVEWSPEETAQVSIEPRRDLGESPFVRVNRIEGLIASGRAAEAVPELEAHAGSLGRHGRLLLTAALQKAEDWSRLERHLSTPENAEEATSLVFALVKQERWERAKNVLNQPEVREILAGPDIKQLEAMVRAEEAISK